VQKEIAILFQDEQLLVAHKPAGLLTVAGDGPSLETRLAEQGIPAEAVHRLDRDVSGCVLCARTKEMRAKLEDLFRERALAKTYWALALGTLEPAVGAWKYPLLEERGQARVSARGLPSLTRYKTLARFPLATELEIDLVTGRYNQIRVHAAHAGHPLAGERKYARGKEDPLRAPRLALHAWRLAFRHPSDGAELRIEAPLPEELVRLRERAAALQRARKPPFASPGS
jgi:RluA family pseudouridine synthase